MTPSRHCCSTDGEFFARRADVTTEGEMRAKDRGFRAQGCAPRADEINKKKYIIVNTNRARRRAPLCSSRWRTTHGAMSRPPTAAAAALAAAACTLKQQAGRWTRLSRAWTAPRCAARARCDTRVAPLPALHTPCTRIERARAVARSACGAISRAAVVALPRPLFPPSLSPPEGLRSCARRAATPRIHAWHVDARVVCVCCPHSDGAQRLALVVVPSSHRCSRGVWHTRARCGRLRAQRGDAGAVSLYAALAARARGIIRVELSSKALRGLVF